MTSCVTGADRHAPVLRDRVIDVLMPALEGRDGLFVDATVGLGGHTEGLLERLPGLRVVGIDRDGEALELAGERLARYGERVSLVRARYDELGDVLRDHGHSTVDAVLFDLGVSSLQVDEPQRGFAYRVDVPLDMRMDQTAGPTAADVLNSYEPERLEQVLREYGEERFARRIARAVAAERGREPFTTSGRLVELLKAVVPVASQRSGGHPAKRTFQALRIEVNGELASWRRALPQSLAALRVGGRVAVLSYHSLEDRIAKTVLSQAATSSTPPGLPVELADRAAYLRLLTRGAERPSAAEVAANPRAASARLRAAERIRATGEGRPGR